MKFGIAEKKTGETIYPPTGQRWTVGKPKMMKMMRDNLLHFQKTEDGWRVRMKDYYDPDNPQTGVYLNLLVEHGSLRTAKTELVDLGFGRETMDTPKPVRLIEHLLRLSTKAEANDLVLDFFAGSCTTAHAVMKLNKEDGGNRRFIMVQLPEKCGEKTEAYKAGYETIADIGKERIRRAAKMLDDDGGFRVLKIGDSNFKDCSLPPEEYKLEDLEDMADNLLPNRKPLDLLFESMLILGLDLHSPIQTKTIQNKQVFFVGDSQAIACFEEGLTEEFAKALVKYKPRRVVFLDGGFASDAVRINIEQLFQQLSPTHFTVL